MDAFDTLLKASAPDKLPGCHMFPSLEKRFNIQLKLVKVFHFRHVDSLILLHLTQKNVITTYSKAARVFPSDHRQTASSRLIQFH